MTGWSGVPVLVTGASGFIGRWVAEALMSRGAELALVSRDPARAKVRMAGWQVGGRWLAADLTDATSVRRVVADAKPALIVNLAAYGVLPSERDPALSEAINARLPGLLAEALAEVATPAWGGCRVLNAGSALEYGTAGGDLHEGTVETPTTLYGRTKLAGTRGLAAAAAAAGLGATTARLFTVYGTGEAPGRLLPTLLAARGHAEPIPLTAGEQRRDFTWVGDVAEGLARLAAVERPPDLVNLATGTLTTVRSFVETAAGVLGIAPSRLRFGALETRAEEMRHDPVSTARLEGLLGWLPRTSIADGVSR